jgi:hypothetical protein
MRKARAIDGSRAQESAPIASPGRAAASIAAPEADPRATKSTRMSEPSSSVTAARAALASDWAPDFPDEEKASFELVEPSSPRTRTKSGRPSEASA